MEVYIEVNKVIDMFVLYYNIIKLILTLNIKCNVAVHVTYYYKLHKNCVLSNKHKY